MLRIGTIGYLHMFDIKENLIKLKEISKSRLVKITKESKVKGGSSDEQYVEYECVSIYSGKTYKFNNYLCPFNFTSLQEMDIILKELYEEGIEMDSIIEKIEEAKK